MTCGFKINMVNTFLFCPANDDGSEEEKSK